MRRVLMRVVSFLVAGVILVGVVVAFTALVILAFLLDSGPRDRVAEANTGRRPWWAKLDDWMFPPAEVVDLRKESPEPRDQHPDARRRLDRRDPWEEPEKPEPLAPPVSFLLPVGRGKR